MDLDDGALCTLDELTELVGTALSVDYPGVPTGRVRDVPDQRVIRWYVTRGLVDRPVATRGRMALYGRRHLLQLVAIKRRQADGASLAEIQAELTGVTDETLAAMARLAPHYDQPAQPAQPAPGAEAPRPEPDGRATVPLSRHTRFWADRPKSPKPPMATATRPPARGEPAPDEPAPGERNTGTGTTAPPPEGNHAQVHTGSAALHAVRLAPGITLLIEDGVGQVTDLAAIQAAARPLLNLLATGGHSTDEE
jgi:DNA-binding transcriptional MerR regulator